MERVSRGQSTGGGRGLRRRALRDKQSPVFMVSHCGVTDTGRVRAQNQDAYIAQAPIFAVADGMGGHEDGDAAAKLVIEALGALAGDEWVSARALQEAIGVAAANIVRLPAVKNPSGSTVTGLALTEQHGMPCWMVFNIGDSRAYRYSDGRLEQITVDHSEVQELVDTGRLTEQEAAHYSRRNIITRALGGGSTAPAVAELWLLPAVEGDRMLICTDGITGELSKQEIESIMRRCRTVTETAETLADAALNAGGRDNLTALVVQAIKVRAGMNAHSAIANFVDEDTRPRTK